MKICIIGAGRKRNGIGQYIAKYFHELGADVVATLGSSVQSSLMASRLLASHGIHAEPIKTMDDIKDDIDVAVIASPAETHMAYLKACIEKGLNVFCEKPFIWPVDTASLESILKEAKDKGITVAMDSQWVFSLDDYFGLCGEIKRPKKFFMHLCPAATGAFMIPDALPHCLSILYKVIGDASVNNIKVYGSGDKIKVSFDYSGKEGICKASILMVRQDSQPRPMTFGFDDKIVKRVVNMEDYSMRLRYGNKVIAIEDPLKMSVEDFIHSYQEKTEPVVGIRHILATTTMLRDIYNERRSC